MQEKQNDGHDKTRSHITLPIEIDRRCREEAKKREIPFSDVFVKAIEERDYLEHKLIEKGKQLEESHDKIRDMISESLGEIRKANLDLGVISKSLISIPTVTEEARRINEHCTKSANIIVNFNNVVSEFNGKISEFSHNINGFNKVLISNKTNSEDIDSYLIKTKKLFESGWQSTTYEFKEEQKKVIKEFKDNMQIKIDEIVNYENLKVNTLNDLFNRKIIIFFVLWIVASTLLAGLYIHDSYVKSGIDSDKIKVFDGYKSGLCSKSNQTVSDVDYSKLCK